MSRFFLSLAFIYTIGIILIAAMQPLDYWLNKQSLWGIYGLIPMGQACPLAIPAFFFLALAMIYDRS